MSQPDAKQIGRRRLLKLGGGAAAGVAAAAVVSGVGTRSGEHTIKANAAGLDRWGRQAGQWIPSCCNMCGGQCGIMVHVVNGVVEKIEPNNWNPNNYTNISSDWADGYTVEQGCKEGATICPKGNAGIMSLYDPDRLKTPLRRTNPDKSVGADPKWQEISWDQALDEIAAKMKTLRDGGEAHKLVWFSEDHSFTHPQQDFCALYGTPNYSNHANLCDVSRKASFKSVLGDERPLADFIESRYIMLFGWNPTSAIKWVHLPRIITRAIENGARMVVVDPYMSDTAAKAQEWVPIRPSTDGAFALALAHVIIRDNLYDKDFVEKWTVGFDQFSAFVKDKTPQWAEGITTVKAATIERLAKELATTKPALVDVWSGPGQHSNGVQGGRAVAILNALIGTIDKPGGMMNPNRGGGKWTQASPDDTAAATLKNERMDLKTTDGNVYPLRHGSGVYPQSFLNIIEGKPYDAKMGVFVFQNVMMSVPGNQKVAQALAKLETVVVIDTMLSETAMLADYALPGTVYLERYDVNGHWVTWPVVGLRQPVVKPIFGQPAEYEIVAALGRRLGLKDKSGKDFFKVGAISGQPIEDLTAWYEEQLSNELKNGSPGLTLDEMKKLPGAVWVDKKGTAYQKYAAALSADALKTAFYDGDPAKDGTLVYDKDKAAGGAVIGVVIGGKATKGFATPSRKVELYAKGLETKKGATGKAVNPLPVYEPRDWQPSEEFPLYLINWKEANHTHTRTQNNSWLLEIKPFGPLVIHPDTAKKYGVGDDDYVWVESPHGKVKARIKVSRRMHPEVVGLQHGWGHTALGENATGRRIISGQRVHRGASDAALRPTKADPLSGQALHKEACVKISKA
ncbi:MAG: molybdopterin-dependent oxidoreductase [Chloroflexi bacterium]|nr:molybdopterin-dependent oxidoreductase [Chloroflexota bacterium]